MVERMFHSVNEHVCQPLEITHTLFTFVNTINGKNQQIVLNYDYIWTTCLIRNTIRGVGYMSVKIWSHEHGRNNFLNWSNYK